MEPASKLVKPREYPDKATTYIKMAPHMTICDDRNLDIGNRCSAKFAGYLESYKLMLVGHFQIENTHSAKR